MTTVARLVKAGQLSSGQRWSHRQLSRSEVEALSLARRTSGVHVAGGYWLTTAEVAAVLGVNSSRVRQLAAAGRIPFVRLSSGRRLYLRAQVEVVANARRVRFPALRQSRA